MAQLLGISTELPPHRVTAREMKTHLASSLPRSLAARMVRSVDASRIATRHLALPPAELLRLGTLESRNEAYTRHAVSLGEKVTRGALDAARLSATATEVLIPVSSAGYMMPSLDAHLINRLGMSPNARRIPLTQLGCSSSVAALGFASQLLRDTANDIAVIVSVELCSVWLQGGEPSFEDVLGSILFGDAAAAVVLSGGAGCGPEVVASRSVLWRDSLDARGIRLTSTGFRHVSSSILPRLIARSLLATVDGFLSSRGLSRADLGFYVVHPGGPGVLDVVAESLGLSDRALRLSWNVWERCGHVSSAGTFLALAEVQAAGPPADGDLGLVLAFGPGVSCEMVLLRWQGELAYQSAG